VIGNFGLDSYDSRLVEYVEGVYVGYRHFDRQYGTEKQALFPFGHGLSYLSFAITSPLISGNISNSNSEIIISAEVENTGTVAGFETIQVYLSPPSGKIDKPQKGLVGFAKVFLVKGERNGLQSASRKMQQHSGMCPLGNG
jgi:beta-glucosidase